MKVPINSLSEPASIIRPVIKFEQYLLEQTMKVDGLLSPITVCDGVIVDGYRRWLVARGLGWTEIDVHKVTGDPNRLRIIAQTRNTTFTMNDKKIFVAQYLEEHPDATAAEIGHCFTWSPIEVEQLCGIGYLIPEAKALYEAKQINLATAWQIARLLDDAQMELLDEGLDDLYDRAEAQLRLVKHARRRAMTTRPRVKSYGKIAREAEHPVYAGEYLIAANAKTPMDGWVAALKWAIQGK